MSPIDLQPVLAGREIGLRPITEQDFDALHQAASDPEIWSLHPDSQRFKRDIFKQRFFEGALSSGGALVIHEIETQRIIGSSRYYEWCPNTREIAIGYTFIERAHWGGETNGELKQLMLNHIFQWADTVWFHVGDNNLRSRRAVEKLGATLSHGEDRELDGMPYVQLYYRLEQSNYIN